eukprot:4704185-Karenia_brevis.AAC.1
MELDSLDDQGLDEDDDAYQTLLRSLEDLAITYRLGARGRSICEHAFAEIEALQQLPLDDESLADKLQC